LTTNSRVRGGNKKISQRIRDNKSPLRIPDILINGAKGTKKIKHEMMRNAATAGRSD